MNEKEKELEFTLEDIIREFSAHPEELDTLTAESAVSPAAVEEFVDEGPDLLIPDPVAVEEPAPVEEITPEPLTEQAPAPEAAPASEEVPAPGELPAPESGDAEEIIDELSLEQIMREFGGSTEPAREPAQEKDIPPAAEPMVLDEIIREYTPTKKEPAPMDPGQTQKFNLDQTQKFNLDEARDTEGEAVPPVDLEQTQRFDPADISAVRAMTDDTIRFTPVSQDERAEEAPDVPSQAPEGAEPFSAGWEPEYDQPMGEYIPPEPIVFRPRSRLGELKKKLIAGPERRYYALLEQGLGKYQVSIFLSLLVVVLSVASIVMYRMGMVQESRMRLLVFGELFAMVFSALLGSERILAGFIAMFKRKFDLDSLLTMTFLICIADGVFCLQEVRVPFCAAFCLEMTMSLWAEYERKNTEMGQMDTLRKATRLNRVAKAPNCFEKRDGFYVTDGEVEDFMDSYTETAGPENAANTYALAAFLASLAIGIVGFVLGGISVGLSTCSAAILAATPVTIFICYTRPAAVLEKRLHKLGAVICGWKGVLAMSGSAVLPLTDRDLFPAGSVKINGVKFYSGRDTDQTIAYATALIVAGQSSLADLFTQLLESRNGYHYEPENLRIYEAGGIGGEIEGESVLVGNLTFLQSMGVEIPDGTRVNQAVYASVDGELCGVFALAYGKLKGISSALGTLCGYRGLTPVLVSDNFLLSEGFIRGKFGVNTRRFAFPSMEERDQITAWNPQPEDSIPCALTTQDGLAPAAFAITGARALRTASILGTAVHIAGGIVGLIVVLVLTLTGGSHLLTPANLLLFELIWTLPGLLITEWTRSI